jgi:UDP-N-acetylmuramyl pentapeptide phosphotransferase/UDP-N-acetylglucosamine-1-phosphate transferase
MTAANAFMAAGIFMIVAAASWSATRGVLAWLERRAILDRPNERSSHTRATPRGGGLAVTAVLLLAGGALAAILPAAGHEPWIVLGGTAILAGLSWLDDLTDLSAALRFGAHILVVTAALLAMPADAPVFQGLLPPWLDRLAAGLLWLWFVNLYNFMDGIDGMSGVETMTLGLGLFALALSTPGLFDMVGWMGLIAAAAALGFLLWNWHPARLFLGDVGSVPLGFLLGWLLLELAAAGQWAAALILPLYYLADATITLGRRALRGEKVWQAHRAHFYQQPAARGWPHDRIMLRVAAANAALAALALIAASGMIWPALIAAAVVVAALLLWLARAGGRVSH